jgi:hypothetical protein
MGSRKRKSKGRTSWGLLLGIGGVALALLIGAGVGIGWLLVRSGNQLARQVDRATQPSPGAPVRGAYDEWVTYEPAIPVQKRTAWVRIRKVLIIDKTHRTLDRLQQELPPEWRASSPADADAIVLVRSRNTVKGMGNAKGDGKVITFTPFDMEQINVVVISPRKEFFGKSLFNANDKVRTVTAAALISWLELLNAEVGGPNDPTKGEQ